jgi:hypothetical protein
MKNWLKEKAEQTFHPDPNYQITRREKRHRWLMFFEKFLNKDFTRKHFKFINYD